MSKFILVPEHMGLFLTNLVQEHNSGAVSVLAVLSQQTVFIPIEYEFTTDSGDRCRVVAWSEGEAIAAVRHDRRFPGELTLQSTCPAWPGTGVTRVVCPDTPEEEE